MKYLNQKKKAGMSAETLLTICIPTYNRCDYLKRTLNYLMESPFKECEIVVLNNASNDGTAKLANMFPHIRMITNKCNIGYANILRCGEYVDTPYIWIIGDDDEYDFSYVDDIVSIMQDGNIGLIHVGAHTDEAWMHGGQAIKPKEALIQGYHFFKYTSFIGCNIIRTDIFKRYLIEGYNNLVNGYPHMPCLLSFFENDEIIYISKNQIAKAIVGNQSYNFDKFIGWWLGTSNLLRHKRDRRMCFFDQFQISPIKVTLSLTIRNDLKLISSEALKGIFKYLNPIESLIVRLLKGPYKVLYHLKNNIFSKTNCFE